MRLLVPSAAIASILLLAGCVGAPEQSAPPAPAPRPATAQPASPTAPAPVEWQYRPATPGSWSYSAQGPASVAIFASPGGSAPVTLRCDGTGRISLSRAGAGPGPMVVRTSYGATSWPVTATPGALVATRAANDATLDQIAYSRGRFAIEVQGLEPLILPAWAEVGRVIEDCRR